MKISIISDIHVHPDNLKGLEILKNFCSNEKVLKSDLIVFLGDIFDLFVYDFEQYNQIYIDALNEIKNLINKTNRVVFVEGNHDFGIRNLLVNKFKKINFEYYENGFHLNSELGRFSFFHGDSIEIDNQLYQIYRFFIKNKFIAKFYKNLVGFEKTWNLGNHLLARSHDRHEKYLDNYYESKVLKKFRNSAELYFKKSNSKFLICGHSHVKDIYKIGEKLYINNGFAQNEKSFIYYDKEFNFINL